MAPAFAHDRIGGDRFVDRRKQKRLFLINRVLIVLAVAAVLAGLFFDQWRVVLRNAILL
jgi:hypothetical protein